MAANRAMAAPQSKLGWVQFGIIITAVITAVIHLYLGIKFSDPLFLLNGIGYLVLLVGLFLQVPIAQKYRGLIRWALMGFAAATIVAWLVMGDKSWPAGALGYVTKAIEIVLIALLFMDRGRS